MLDRIQIVRQRFNEVSDLIIQPDIITDQKRYIQLNKEYKDLRKLLDIGEEYEIDPIKDLRPVCPNCHAMLHRNGNISIEELKSETKSNKANY